MNQKAEPELRLDSIAIVGGGIAGLTCGIGLLGKNVKLDIYEGE